MTERNPEIFHLSASAIASFKACPTRFRLQYREGLRPAEDTDSLRMGTNWHALHEVYQNSYQEYLNETEDWAGVEDEDEAKQAHAKAHDFAFNTAVEHLNDQYEQVPATKTPEEWECERQQLLMSFVGYLWYWQNDPLEVLASEVEFKLPLHAPRTGLPLPLREVVRLGKIDHVVRWHGMVGNVERKSTSRSIEPGSDFWERAQKDTQVSMYALAFHDMREHGLEHYGIEGVRGDERIGSTLYDVWRKPTINLTKLSQKDTAALIETGEYHGVKFEVKVGPDDPENPEGDIRVTVDGTETEVIPGKKGFAIRETPEMYGARLLADIYERPDYYFQRQEIARTDRDLARFRVELFNIYQAQRQFAKNGCWYENEQQCRATFPCPFIPICYGPGADAVCDGETTPDNFKRIFTKETVDGE